MVRLRGVIKRGFLRSLWRAAKPSALSVAEMLAAFQDSGFQWVKSGRLVLSTSGGGYSSSFTATETVRELTQEEVFALSEEFFAIYEDCQALSPAPADDDAMILAMLADDRMQTVRQEMLDVTGLRFYVQGGTV